MVALKAKQDALARAFQESYPTFEGWKFELEGPGYLSYVLPEKWRIIFTPNEHRQGYVTISVKELVTGAGWGADNHVPSHVPVDAKDLFEIVRPWLERFGEDKESAPEAPTLPETLFAVVCRRGSICQEATGTGSTTSGYHPCISTEKEVAEKVVEWLNEDTDWNRKFGSKCGPHRVVEYRPSV